MLLFIVDVMYLLLVLLLYKMRSSKKDGIRMISNDYELYERLPEHMKQTYWKEATQRIMLFMVGIGVVMNIEVLISDHVPVMFGVVCIVFAYILRIVCYFVKYRTLVKKVQG